jgi:WD40 repeat protein
LGLAIPKSQASSSLFILIGKIFMSSLQATPDQLQRIRQARIEIGWPIDDPQWLIAASKILEPDQKWDNWDETIKLAVSIGTWKRFLAGKPIRPEPYKAFCQILDIPWQETIAASQKTTINHDWGEAPPLRLLIDRSTEISTIQQWISQENTQLITILGIGGIGKTSIATKIAQTLSPEFEHIIWRSLREAPSIEKIISDTIKHLTQHQSLKLPLNLPDQIELLIQQLKKHRCLIILDNIESILPRTPKETNDYEKLFQRIGQASHQSCLILTSREQPHSLRQIQSNTIRTLQLTGLQQASQILTDRGITGTDQEIHWLINKYQGNPLALEIVTEIIKNLYGSIHSFSQAPGFVVGGIRSLLKSQFDRLTPAETSVIYWLAIHREPVTIRTLKDDSLEEDDEDLDITAALNSLHDRGLIQVNHLHSVPSFTLQNVIMEYVTDRLIKSIAQEFISHQFHFLRTHAIMQATAKEYIRNTQKKLLLTPIGQKISNHQNITTVTENLQAIIQQFRQQSNNSTGYAIGNIINLLLALKIDLTNYDFSQLTIHQAYLQQAELPQVNFTRCHFSQTIFSQDLGSIFTVTFSLDHRILVTGGMDGKIRIWQVADGKQIHAWQAHDDWIRHVTFSPDGQLIASCSNDRSVKIWKIPNREIPDWENTHCLYNLQGHTDWVWSARFIAIKGILFLISVSQDRTARFWNINFGKFIRAFSQPQELVWSVAFSNNGRLLATSSTTYVKLWSVLTRRCIKTFTDQSDRVRALAFHPNGKTLVGSDDFYIKIWDLKSGECIKTCKLPENSAIWSLSFSPDGQQLISAGTDKIQIWNANTWQPIATMIEPRSRIRSISYSPDQTMMAVGSDDQLVRIWDTKTSQPIKTLAGASNRIWTIAVSPNTSSGIVYLASGSDDCQIRIWNGATGELLQTLRGHQGRIRSLAFSPSGKLLASGSHDRTIKIWDVATSECLTTYDQHTDWVWSVIFDQDDQTLISAADDRTILRWNIATSTAQALPELDTVWIWAIAAHPQLPLLAVTGVSEQIELRDNYNGKITHILTGHQQRIRSIVFNASGTKLASSSDDLTIKLWDMEQQSCLQTFTGHSREIRAVIFIPASATTSELLVSASDDLTIRIWDTALGECLRIIQGHTQGIWSLCYSSALQILFSCSQDETIKLWDVKTWECKATLIMSKPYDGMQITGVSGLSIATQTTLITLGAIQQP